MKNALRYIRNILLAGLANMYIFSTFTPYIICLADELYENHEYVEEPTKDTNAVEKEVYVTDIEIDDYNNELIVGEYMQLTTTLVPDNATDSRITYKSSNDNIATVTSSGKIKGISSGQVIIYVTCGSITKEVALTVRIQSKAININTRYKVIQVGDKFKLEASVNPDNSGGALQYKSSNPKVASVSSTGIIEAKSCGSTSIMVYNNDIQMSVTVIVNQAVSENENANCISTCEDTTQYFSDKVDASTCEVISSEILKYCYDNKKTISIEAEKYIIYINGDDIVNYDNELNTKLVFDETDYGLALTINEGNMLCGRITVDISKIVTNEKYLYIYNKEQNKYQKLQVDNIKNLSIDTAGTYILTSEPISNTKFNIKVIIIVALTIVACGGIYIVVTKKYLFW